MPTTKKVGKLFLFLLISTSLIATVNAKQIFMATTHFSSIYLCEIKSYRLFNSSSLLKT